MVKLGVSGGESLALASISCVADASSKQKKGKKKMSEQKKSQSLEEPFTEGLRNGHNPPLSRSKTYDPSFSKEVEKEGISSQHKNSVSNLMKHAINFHRAFKELPDEEELLHTVSCAWQREVPYHGRLYVSPHHVCFYCSMIRREVKVMVPVPTISVLKKANTSLLVPNAISVRTAEGEKFLFGSLRSRESTYQLLRSVCKHLQDVPQENVPRKFQDASQKCMGHPGETPEPGRMLAASWWWGSPRVAAAARSRTMAAPEQPNEDGSRNCSPTTPHPSTEHLLKISLISREADPSQDLPEQEMLPDVPDRVSESERPPKASAEQQLALTSSGGEHVKRAPESWWARLNLLNTVILVYLFVVVVLLLSSGYIGLRIIQLEEQLTSMGAWPKLELQHGYKTT